MSNVEDFVNDAVLKHRQEYDPAAAREYYLRTRELKGRKAAAPETTTLSPEQISKGKKFQDKSNKVFADYEALIKMVDKINSNNKLSEAQKKEQKSIIAKKYGAPIAKTIKALQKEYDADPSIGVYQDARLKLKKGTKDLSNKIGKIL